MENVSPAISAEAELLLDTLRSFTKPAAFAAIWALLKEKEGRPTEPQAKELLPVMVKAGLVRRAGKSSRVVYWLPALDLPARDRFCAALADGPRSKAGLDKILPGLLPGWPPAQRAVIFQELVQAGRIYKWPPLKGNVSLFSLQPPDPQMYLQKPIEDLADKIQRLAKQFAALGIESEQVYALANELWQQALPASATTARLVVAPAPEPEPSLQTASSTPQTGVLPDYEQLILEGMHELEPAAASRALVSLPQLRRRLAAVFPSKTAFDQTVLQLAQQDRVALHWHDYPSSLSQAERDELVCDTQGRYYIGIALIN